MKLSNPLVYVPFLLFVSTICRAQTLDGATVLVDIAPCMALETTSARHGCYDRLEAAARAAQQQSKTETASVTRTLDDVPAVPEPGIAAAVDDFGERTTAAARVTTNDEGQQELRDRIASLEEREPGRWLITLDSGQIWYQTNSGRIRLSRGMEVRIYPSPLGGSFRLAGIESASTGFVQVRRVQ